MASSGKKKGGVFPSKIKSCTCVNTYQDKKYGKNKRVMNSMQGKAEGFRCTVCGETYQMGVKKI